MKDFSVLPAFLQEALARLEINTPTPIQAGAIPPVLEGKDVLGTAQTGTGKTFAFLLPLVALLTERPQENALVLAPTRELAQQTFEELKKLADPKRSMKAALVIGGDNVHKQYADLRSKPRIIIGTPGRIIDHMQRKTINLKSTRYLVLDETDRMLDMGFIAPIRRIVGALPTSRQTLLFSATMPKEIVSLAEEFLNKPVRIQIGSVVSPADLVLQEIIHVATREKLPQLLHELNTRQGSVLIFTRTKHGADRLAKQLKLYGQKVNALHGDLRQNRRRQVLEFFRNETVRILVATDVAARGIDVPHIAHVINYDLPQCPEDYIHRIGRTGRAGAVGSALSLIGDDAGKWKDICKVTKFSIPVKTVQKTITPLPAPKFVAEEEGEAHSHSRKKEGQGGGRRGAQNGGRTRVKRDVRPSKATETAKRLLADGEVNLPQTQGASSAEKPVEARTRPARTHSAVKSDRKPAQRTARASHSDKRGPAPERNQTSGQEPRSEAKKFKQAPRGGRKDFGARSERKGFGGRNEGRKGAGKFGAKGAASHKRGGFHKAQDSARVLDEKDEHSFRKVKVGASKKKLHSRDAAPKKSAPQKKAGHQNAVLSGLKRFAKFFKSKKR